MVLQASVGKAACGLQAAANNHPAFSSSLPKQLSDEILLVR